MGREGEALKEYAILAVLVTFLLLACFSLCHASVIDLAVISKIESSNNPLAYNKGSGARGLYQITPICLAEYNTFHNTAHQPRDLFNASLNTKVASWYFEKRIPQMLRHYRKPVTVKNIIVAYNAGIRYAVRDVMPKETRLYIAKYNRLTGGR